MRAYCSCADDLLRVLVTRLISAITHEPDMPLSVLFLVFASTPHRCEPCASDSISQRFLPRFFLSLHLPPPPGSHRPDLSAPIPPAADQILVNEPHPLRWLGMPIDHHSRMSVRGPVVHLDAVLPCARDDFARVELEGRDGVFVPVGFGYGPGANVPDLCKC
jgi:hypothetical protein